MVLPERYTELLLLSEKMLVLAKNQEWEALGKIEAQRAQMLPGLCCQPANLELAAFEEIADVIRQIQAIDREILDYVTPWREQAATLLSHLKAPPNTST